MAAFNLCIIVPVYNHAASIPATVRKIRAQTPASIIIINDGSDENCTTVLRKLANDYTHINLVELPKNSGKGGAVKEGLKQAKHLGFSHGLQFDADGQHDANDIPKFVEAARHNLSLMIVGTPEYDESVPKVRYFGRYLTHVWVWINTLSFEIRDSMCGFRIYPTDLTVDLMERVIIGDRMDFDIDIIVRWFQMGRGIKQIPTRIEYPDDGVSHFRMWRDNILISRLHAKLFLSMLLSAPIIFWKKLNGTNK